MAPITFVRWHLAGLIVAGAATAHAQTPPIKPGLWHVTSERVLDGQKAPDLAEHMKNMPAEMRERMQANMKQHGVDMSGGPGNMKVCMTKESLDQGRWRSDDSSCKTEFGARTAKSWKWRSTCSQPPSISDGEATFTTNERYTVKVSTTMAQGQRHRVSQLTMNGKWLGGDCGDLKPVASPARAGASGTKR